MLIARRLLSPLVLTAMLLPPQAASATTFPMRMARMMGMTHSAATSAAEASLRVAPSAIAERSDVRDLGELKSNVNLPVTLVLKYQHQAELESLVALQSDPSSRYDGAYLSEAQFDNYFSPSLQDYARLTSALQKQGFKIRQTFPNRVVLDAVAPVASIERYFKTSMHAVYQANVGARFANVTPVNEPDDIKDLLVNVTVDNIVRAKPAYQINTSGNTTLPATAPAQSDVRTEATAVKAAVSPTAPTGPLMGPREGVALYGGTPGWSAPGYGPTATSKAYDFPVMHGYNGQGRATAVVISGDFRDADLAMFLKYFGVKRTGRPTVRRMVDGGAKFNPNFNFVENTSVEATLDVETIVGNAPGTNLYVYLIPDLTPQSIEDAYEAVVSDGIADVVSSSFYENEGMLIQRPYGTPNFSYDQAFEQLAIAGAAKGITFAACSGDGGATGSDAHPTRIVSSPSSAPHFVGVGGTALAISPTGAFAAESAWNGSGGGVSMEWPLPAYQASLPGVLGSTRNVPDIAFAAGANVTGGSKTTRAIQQGYGAAFIMDNVWAFSLDGTSWSTPLYAALQTEIDQRNNRREGFVNPKLYSSYKTLIARKNTSVFHDTLLGSTLGTGNNNNYGGYTAHKGYDNATGLGSADGYLLSTVL